MAKRYQIRHFFNKWIAAESFNTLLGATNFARRVMRANSKMLMVKVVDNNHNKAKFNMDRRDK